MKDLDIPILVIDRHAYWRELTADTLRSAGYLVATSATYDDTLLGQHKLKDFALVLLGCTNVEVEERMLIARLLAHEQRIIVLANSLPAHIMRTLFIRGVEDASDKTYDPTDLVTIVEQALERIASRKILNYPLNKEIYRE